MANKKVQMVQDVPISISTINSEDIQLRSINTMDRALAYVPGVEVNQDNISIRGTSGFSFGIGSRVLMLQDGFPMLSGDNNDIKFDNFPFLFIERVEIVKGSGSALYGTSALGGVVNVITSDATDKPVIRARLYSGAYDSPKYDSWKWTEALLLDRGLDLAFSNKSGDLSYLSSVSFFSGDSYRQYNKSERYNLFTKFNYDLSEFSKLGLQLSYTSAISDDWVYWQSLSSPLIPPEDTNTDILLNSDKLSIFSDYRYIMSDESAINFKAGILNTDFRNTFEVENPDFRSSIANSLFFETQLLSSFNENTSYTIGIDIRHNDVNSVTYGDNRQSILASYFQTEYDGVSDLIITTGLRVDKEIASAKDIPLQLSPKLGLNYSLNQNLNIRASFGRGFRAPSIAERYASVNFQGFRVIENPDLLPEISTSVEFGLAFNSKVGNLFYSIDIAGFSNNLYDLIEPNFIIGEGATVRFENITRARINGLEAILDFEYAKLLNFKTGITLLDPKDLSTNTDLRYRSNILWYNSLALTLSPITLQVDYRYKSQFNEIDERLAIQIRDHDIRVDAHILDLQLATNAVIGDLKGRFLLQIRNALNYYHLSMVGNMAPIRFFNFQFELEY